MTHEYIAPNAEKSVDFINLNDLAEKAEKIIPSGGWGYIRGGAGDEWTLRRNIEAFDDVEIYPRVLAAVEKPDLSTSILGIDISLPVIMAPCASQGLAHASAEKGTAKGASAAGTIMTISNYANDSIEEIAKAGANSPQWFQIYLNKDDRINHAILDTAVQNGAKAIVLTADATMVGNREADKSNQFKMLLPMSNLDTYIQGQGISLRQIFANTKQKIAAADISAIATYSRLPVIVKGIQNADDALTAIGAGASAVWVSNHGGRQLDGGPGSIEVLDEIAAVINKSVPIIFDSGIRRGQHVFKALASGADVVAIGRPALYGLSVGGWQGVKSVFDFFARELTMVMQLAGTQNIEEIKRANLRYVRDLYLGAVGTNCHLKPGLCISKDRMTVMNGGNTLYN